jgi:prophage regulatory protein
VPTSEILRESARKAERRRQRVAESRQRAVVAVKTAGLRRILRLPEVEAVTGLKRSQIYEDILDGTFPTPVPLGERAVGWIEDEVAAWLDARIAERDAELTEREGETARGREPARTQGRRPVGKRASVGIFRTRERGERRE